MPALGGYPHLPQRLRCVLYGQTPVNDAGHSVGVE